MATETTEATVRIPANIMGLLRQSYDSRERILDWCLAIAVAFLVVWLARDHLTAFITRDPSVNADRDDPPQPSQDVADAFPAGSRRPDIYTYNLPPTRNIRYQPGPMGPRPPYQPATPSSYEGSAS